MLLFLLNMVLSICKTHAGEEEGDLSAGSRKENGNSIRGKEEVCCGCAFTASRGLTADELMFCPEKGSALLPEHTFVSGDDECPLISLAKIKRSSFFYQPNPLQIIQQFFLQPGSAQAGLALEQGGSLPLLWG